MSTSKPPALWVLLSLCALAVLPIVASYAGAVGAFRMFTRPFETHVALWITTPDGSRVAVPFETLTRHLSRDDRRVLMPAVDWAPGETAASLLDADDLAALVCALHPEARVA